MSFRTVRVCFQVVIALVLLGAAMGSGVGVAGSQARGTQEPDYEEYKRKWALDELRGAKSAEERVRALRKVASAGYRTEETIQAVVGVATAPGEPEVFAAAIDVLTRIGGPEGLDAVADVAVALPAGESRRSCARTLIQLLIKSPADASVERLDGLLGTDQVGDLFERELRYAMRGKPGLIDVLVLVPEGPVQAMALAAMEPYRKLDPDFLAADIAAIQRWREKRLNRFKDAVAQHERSIRVRPRLKKTYEGYLRETQKAERALRKAKVRDVGVEVLAEYYEVTSQAAGAVLAIQRATELSESLAGLPTLLIERVDGRVDGRGEFHRESSSLTEVDLGDVSKRFFLSWAAVESVSRKRAADMAGRDRGLLLSLSAEAQHLIAVSYAERVLGPAEAKRLRSLGFGAPPPIELLKNGACDAQLKRNGDIPHWTAISGTWHRGEGSFDPRSGAGCFSANGVPCALAELQQRVSIGRYQRAVDLGKASLDLEGWLRTYDQGPGDTARILVEFFDAGNQALDGSMDTGAHAPRKAWMHVQESVTVPRGARSAVVRLVTKRRRPRKRNRQKNVDGHFDDLSLRLRVSSE